MFLTHTKYISSPQPPSVCSIHLDDATAATGHGASVLTTHQLQVERRESHRANQVDGIIRRLIDTCQWWEFGQDTGVTPLLLQEVPWDF